MKTICIQVPSLQENDVVDVEVTVNGEKRLINYRVESFDWTRGGFDTEHRIERLRELIKEYDSSWELVQIGMPDRDLIPVMFRRSARVVH